MGLSRASDETNNEYEHNMVKNPNWQEADQLTIYKHVGLTQLASLTHLSEDPMVCISFFFDKLLIIYIFYTWTCSDQILYNYK